MPLSAAQLIGSRDLDASIGAPGPHDFAVRNGSARPAPPLRPSHPAPDIRDDAYAPLVGRDAAINEADLPDDAS
ncbi:hypothetical protein SSBR45G_32620 [Bradyrhizobium sp. SSBR45G]|nr:hypothetical protein SSBR45G_32620 [Bradyrhizobium sp. SSBR45G]GLH86136.1 hypothetical protein SSBR45R_35960 [Bradyrhizobium sp. SSBR45R]